MKNLRKHAGKSCLLVTFVLFFALSAQAEVFNGELTTNDPSFWRPSTIWSPGDPCAPSTTSSSVYYDTYVYHHTGGKIRISLSASNFEPVIIFYSPPGSFDPNSSCNNFFGILGCRGNSFDFISPEDDPAGDYEIVVTSCGDEETGLYSLELTSFGQATVPTINEWGAILLTTLLAGASIVVIRGRC